ncbi:Hint domain-containing protein [Ruegeria arenilitoris]|uniref:Hint domain-containing protein n=1 Tax=Ruegeria arenilitoris TaxID=1173585 RepID=UPI00147D0EB3|nr:Hint domain-containing protein [Ruegeria arenilitoris]
MVSTPIDPFDAVLLTISGDTSGTVTGEPPLPATGELDGTIGVPGPGWTPFATFWEISTPPQFGTASITLVSGQWTYEVDPAYYNSLDPGTYTDTFVVRGVGTAFNPGGELRGGEAFQTITIEIEVVCFALGTLIETPSGPVPVDRLEPGDLVLTMDRGAQPVRWAESARISADQLDQSQHLCPIEIAPGALGPNRPSRPLRVSPQHRMLLDGPLVELLFGESEALVAACHMVGLPGIRWVRPRDGVTYVHVLLDRHEILFAEGAPAESLFLGEEALTTLSSDGLQELADIFGDQLNALVDGFPNLARRALKRFEAQVFLSEYAQLTDRSAAAAELT